MRRLGIAALLVVIGASACADDSSGVFTTTSPAAEVTTTTSPQTTTTTSAPVETTPSTTAPTTTTSSRPRPTAPLSEVNVDVAPFGDGFGQPVFATARRSDGRLFVVDQAGSIVAVDLFASGFRQPILDITDRVRSGGEQGLLGLAFHPTEPDRMFVHYSARDGSTTVSEFALGPDGTADPGAERILLTHPQPATNHNGGMIEFGPDEHLYIGLGDGGGANDQFGTGQDPFSWLGTILRIDVDGDPYAVPPGNPFADGTAGAPEVWAWGLRNPWRFAFDGFDLWVGDVGQRDWEEIDLLDARTPGVNAGWPILEGTHCFAADPCSDAGLLAPIFEYAHTGERCSVTGGFVYRGSAIPELTGAYLFGDYCTGEIWALRPGDPVEIARLTDDDGIFLPPLRGLTSFGRGPEGEIFLLQESGLIWQLVPTG
jgi:glucose/arabinose dehydrogenase